MTDRGKKGKKRIECQHWERIQYCGKDSNDMFGQGRREVWRRLVKNKTKKKTPTKLRDKSSIILDEDAFWHLRDTKSQKQPVYC